MLTSDDIYLFSNGMWQRAWEKMGAHRDVQNGTEGWMFRVWAPQVVSVHLVGDFNGWDPLSTPLTRADNSDIWEAFVPGLQLGDLYKYAIKSDEGELLWKADPFGFFAETCPGTASKLWDISGYAWKDATWLRRRAERDIMKSPLNIYEVHLGSWKRHGSDPQGEPREDGTWPGPGDPFPAQRGTYYTYDDLSDELVAYVKKMGYTHIEVMPLMEHPFDGSWGYQATGYFAATSRYGTPQQLMHFVDSCHKAGIGVILDWVPGGFCANAEGLATFNGHMLFEREIHPNWGTHKFDFGRPEVRSFLVSNVLFWIENFHVDGIRMDGVSSMLYLNFGVDNPADKKFNKYGTEEDLDASAFIRQVNCAVGREFPDVMMIAEESTAWPLVTYPAEDGGLGFHLKWDMGWMNDTLHYMQCDFPWRPGNHSLLTFSIMYAFSENFVLPLSHDEVVNGKCSLIGRMPGDDWRRFAGLRTLAFYQMTHPGAKLNFMGNEIGQQIEWRYYESIEWFLAHDFDATHGAQQRFIEALNHLYTDQKALWQNAYSEKGFEWIDADNSGQSILSFVRHGDKPADDLLVLINFDPASYETYRVGVPREGDWELVFTSDDPAFGGSGYPKVEMASSKPEPWNGRDESIEISVPGLAGLVYRRRRASSYKPAKPAKKATGKAKSASARAAKPKAAKAAKTAKVAPKAAKEPTKTSRAKKA
ncbi:1,4-alpha-glucan branching protein GlgB [uncultured Collinsella sp.]|uniref:1,4-alpha-glucan branching protein GlgB n=1 Tax=uncultured Collinsella sp. TaxID=165190 RepID=UPI0025F6C4EC|nr:1,4-alpha-glucan branching protein GlgB [uncultured Collinsella sp.]